ncbi:AAA family ATPase [Pseudorhodobacter sp. W20_MBD10_FR17]|uniref:bifunctional aminoglycoside phosphotransferase/ATP-binding protein n=1 Tax=Pseudorhodobacter sp. W20_MBD10_FR17 TaxID=3240266 RepID=UPI003F9AD187
MQDEVIAFLTSPDGHPGGGPVEVVQTHGALVFLGGEVALKIKRAVRYDYMDLSTLDLREAMLRRELELNKPAAPKIYQKVVAITRSPDGGLALGGAGEPVEWALQMWRFPADAELAVIADTKGIDDGLADDLGVSVFAFHEKLGPRTADGALLIANILDELDRVFVHMTGVLGAPLIDHFHSKSRRTLEQITPLLQRRGQEGHIRRCHGDLHLRNLVILEGKPVPFDALEFDEVLGTCDVLYDLAFLIMDLRHRDLDRAANMVLNAYLLAALGQEDNGLAALPLFLGVRAAIRAMVLVQAAAATGAKPDPEAVQLLTEAIAYLTPEPVTLVLVGGLSGSGKTTVSRALAPLIGAAPGAVHLRSDLERKAMQGLPVSTPMPTETYTPNARDSVYNRVFERARTILATGHSVLLDATFLNPDHRRNADAVAQISGATLHRLWLDAPLHVLSDRVRARKGDASDADESVVLLQSGAATKPENWQVVSAAGDLPDTIRLAQLALNPASPNPMAAAPKRR